MVPSFSERSAVDPKAFYKMTYGLFVLTAQEGDVDNGCIINTAGKIGDAVSSAAEKIGEAVASLLKK